MKVIDLLNKINNREEVPEQVKFENTIFNYDKQRNDYIHEIDDFHSETLLFVLIDSYFIKEVLEIKVEVIEENKEIKEIPNEIMKDDWRYYVSIFYNKTNELIRAVNKLNKEKD